MAIQLTRAELFEQVWERPMIKVAAEYGISDVALKKVCVKHRIPVPGRGYWAKKAAGKKVERAYFRAVSDPAINRIVIHGSPIQHLPKMVKEAREAARRREHRPENQVDVVQQPNELHPKVVRTKKRLEKAKPLWTGLVKVSGTDLFDVQIGPDSVDRVSAFLNALVMASADREYRLAKGERALVFVVDDECLNFKVVEQTTRTKHEPTEAELAAIERWEKRQQRRLHAWDRGQWTPRPAPTEWDVAPNGLLRVMINDGVYGYQGLRRSFGDGKTQRIENLANPILEAFATWSAAIKARRIEDERRKREWAEAERQRKELQRRDALETKRVEALCKDLKRWKQRRLILDYIAAVEAKLGPSESDDSEAVRAWIAWAKAYAHRLDPLTHGWPRLLDFDDFKPWELQ